jgi:hypothetical protein
MSEPIDIISDGNPLDKVISDTIDALTAVKGKVGALQVASTTFNDDASYLAQCITQEIDVMLQWTAVLTRKPKDDRLRGRWAEACQNLHRYGEETTALLGVAESNS